MDNIVESLFGLTPFQVQQQQNAGLNQAADRYASQDPFQRATGGMFRAGGMLGGAGAQAMGMVNPQMEQAKLTEAMMASGGDLSTSQGLMAKSQQFAAAGDQRTALKLALAGKAKQVEEEKAKLAIRQENRKDYAAKPDLEKYAMVMAKRSDLVEGTPEFDDFVSTWMYEQKEKANKPTNDIQEYEYARKNNGYKGTLEQWMQKKAQSGSGGSSESKQPLVYIDPVTGKAVWGNIGEAKGKPAAAFDPITKQLVSQGVELGKERGAEIANLPKMESALTSVKGAEELLNKGIYTGFWGPTQKTAIAATPGTDKGKVSNTDQFVAYIGEVVVPRLKEFGGNDSNEELKYLQKISGGDISMQEPALRAILKNAETKIQRGVDRVKKGMTASGVPAANQGGIEKWVRDANGKLVRQ